MKRFLVLALTLVPLAACNPFGGPADPVAEDAQESSRAETRNVVYRGTLLPLGASIYMEGTHRLTLEDGRFILLEANGLLLDEYLNREVEVFGTTRATVEGGGIIMRVERVAELAASSAASSEAAVSSDALSSSAVASSAPAAPASRAPAPASVAPPSSAPVASSQAPVGEVASSSAESDALSLRAAAMAKANMDAANWTQEYCSTHIQFCIPVHKNWYYVSFGATSSSQWHVELSSEEILALGDGPVTIVLHTGTTPAADGHVTVEGGVATGYRAWTNNRHFVISAPAVLEAAVRHITQELTAAPAGAVQ